MGKSGYKRFKKQEKAKVKLKGNKTLLPKGQNVTDTSFKVKKIVVKEQLKHHGEHELLSKKHLNIKELMSRLSHHNSNMRLDALSGLKELVTAHGPSIVQANLSPLLQAVVALTIDRESDVRRDTLKLLSAIFQSVKEEELSPVFGVVVSHLSCAMTHIEVGVRCDSLRLLDTLLAAEPALTAAHCPVLLPRCLDLISQRGDVSGARTLALHLDGRITSDKWRSQVIARLNRLFAVILQHNRRDELRTPSSSVRWTPQKHMYLGLYTPVKTGIKKPEDLAELPMQDYANMLMPLLLDTFTEAVPKQDKEDSQTASIIGEDVAVLLQSIVEIILHIRALLKQSHQSESLMDWLREVWGEAVTARLVSGRLPYSVSAANNRKRRRDTQQVTTSSCSLLNLQLCLLTFLLGRPGHVWAQAMHHIRRSVRRDVSLRPEESSVLCDCLEAACDVSSLLGVLSKCGILAHSQAFHFLTRVALQPSHPLHKDSHFTSWLDSLPGLLCRPVISLATLRSLAAIAARSQPAFLNSLNGWIEEILRNLPTLRVSGDPDNEGPRLITGLVYWLTDWDPELVQLVQRLIQHNILGAELTSHLVDILRLKVENTEVSETRKMIEEILP